ncbi:MULTISPECIES: Nramp family divalent metal transporter [unclassified Streptomyces]|uniref:Nramp family divalent metal transporter n=1 Tax=unclassified Streptomyces TaxID=2593676 RepID=UPI002E2BF94C|nr:Nramp family divalent metal transporter [Streptomyces sp. NBC_00223]
MPDATPYPGATRPPRGLHPGRARPVASRAAALAGLCGPAFVVAVAYVDPGNFATNMTAGARHGCLLLWVIAAANVLAMFVQYLSAKAGLATGRNLAELCRERCPRWMSRGLWFQAELVAMATDLAEFVGGALALNLLFGLPMLPAALLTAVVGMGVLTLAQRGRRRFESAVVAMLAVVFAGFCYQTFRAGAPAGLAGGFVPRLDGTDSTLLAAGIVGATVMPHVIYLHSSLTQRHRPADARQRRTALRATRLDIGVALGLAGVVNMTMLVVAAVAFGGQDMTTGSLPAMHAHLGAALGSSAALAFALALLAAGLASSSVGTYAGQVVMAGFLRRQVPLLVRRLVTVLPALGLLAAGVDPTQALVLSQVALSFGIPFALVPLIAFTARRDIMGDLVNRRATTVLGIAVVAAVIGFNGVLLIEPLTG